MDTEEQIEIEHKKLTGKAETDEGPYYHESWWESYKGSVKGMLGGLAIGAIAGVVIGAVAAAAISLLPGVHMTAGGVGMMLAAFSGFGMYHGAKEFGSIGTVTGAVAAAHETSEERMKEFESEKFREIKTEISELKAAIAGKTGVSVPENAAKKDAEATTKASYRTTHKTDSYRTSHCDSEHCPPTLKPIYWKVAAIGMGVGTVAGAALGTAGMFSEFMHPMHSAMEAAGMHIGENMLIPAASIVGGATGLSFGINRDVFRQVLDRTDRWFRGHFTLSSPAKATVVGVDLFADAPHSKSEKMLIEPPQENTKSDTHFRDTLLAERGRKALLALDHTTIRPC